MSRSRWKGFDIEVIGGWNLSTSFAMRDILSLAKASAHKLLTLTLSMINASLVLRGIFKANRSRVGVFTA